MKRKSPPSAPSRDEVFTEYFSKHVGAAHAAAVRRVGVEGADDVVAEAFALAWQKQAHSLPPAHGRAWLLVTVANLSRNVIRFKARTTEKITRYGAFAAREAVLEEPPEHPYFADAWALLSARDQELLATVYWDDLPYPDAAQALGVLEGTLRTRISRAKSRLRDHLESFTQSSVRAAGDKS